MGKHASGSPRRRATYRGSDLIGTAARTAAAAGAAETPARGCRRATAQSGPRAALTTTIAAGVVAVATGSVAYSTALEPTAATGTATAPAAGAPDAGAATPGGAILGQSTDRVASGPDGRPRPARAGVAPAGGHGRGPIAVGPTVGAAVGVPVVVVGAPFEFVNPLLPAGSPGAVPGAPRPVEPGGATVGQEAQDVGLFPARALPVLVKMAEDEPAGSADSTASSEGTDESTDDSSDATAGDAGSGTDAGATGRTASPAPAPQGPTADRHQPRPISVGDWFRQLRFRDTPPDPFRVEPHASAATAAPHTADVAEPAEQTTPAAPVGKPDKTADKTATKTATEPEQAAKAPPRQNAAAPEQAAPKAAAPQEAAPARKPAAESDSAPRADTRSVAPIAPSREWSSNDWFGADHPAPDDHAKAHPASDSPGRSTDDHHADAGSHSSNGGHAGGNWSTGNWFDSHS